MKIKCSACDTAYDVSPDIADGVTQVQCARCGSIFAAEPFIEPENVEPAPPEPMPQAPDEAAEPAPADDLTSLLSDDEKALFASFLDKTDAEEPPAAEAPADPPPTETPGATQADIDDIGWSEEEEEDAPAPAMAMPEIDDDEPEAEQFDFDALADEVPEPEAAAVEEPAADEPATNEPEVDEPEADAAPQKPLHPAIDESDVETDVEPPAAEPKPADVKPTKKRFALTPVVMGWGALAASILVVIAATLTFRVAITQVIPGMAALYEMVGLPVNVRGLEFAGLTHQWLDEDGHLRLVVRGEIVNITDKSRPVPEIVFAMHDASGLEFFQWTEQAGKKSLPPHARTRFHAQIPAPPDRVRKLQIRFARR